MFKSQKILQFVPAANPAHPMQPPYFYPQSHPMQPPYFNPQSHPIQPPYFYPQSHPIQPPHFYPQTHPIQPPHLYPKSHPIQPPHFYPQSHPIQPPHFYPQSQPIQPPYFYPQSQPIQPPYFYRSSHPAMPPHFYPTPSMMEMKHHSSIPSVQQQYPPATPAGFYPHDGYMCNGVYYPTPRPPQYTWPLLAKKERALCEDEGVQDGSIITPQAPATDVLTLDEQVPPVYTLWAVPDLEPQPTSDLPLDQSSHAISKAFLSTHPTPSSLTLAEIMGAEKAEPSTPPTPTPLTGGEIMDGKEADPYKVPPPTPLTLGEIKEQTVDIDEIVKSIRKWLKDQVMKDKTKKFPMDKSHHSNYTKCEDEGVQDGSIITPQAPATDVLTLDEQVPPVYTLWAVPDLEPQLTSDLPPDQSSHAISEASIYTPPTPSSLTLSEIMEAEPSTSPTLSALALAEIMRAEEAEPSTPPAPTPLTGGEILDGKEAEPYKVPPPTPLTLGEIKEQTVDIDEIVKSIRKWLKDQVMKDKTKKFPMDKSYHCRYTKCEDEGVQDGSIITPQAPATDVLTLDEQVPPVYTLWAVPDLEPQPTFNLPPDQSSHAISKASLYTPPTPSSLTLAEIMEAEPSTSPTLSALALAEIMGAEEAEPSTPPIPSSLTLSEIMEAEPSTPPTPTPLTGGEILDGKEAEPYKVPPPTPLTLGEIKEQTVDIDEIVKSIRKWLKDQVMKDKTKKFPMDKFHHSNYTKCEDEGVQDGSIITPQAPATDVLTLDEQVPPVYTLWAVPDLEPQPTNYLPPDQSSHAISEASLYTPPTPSSLTLSEIMEAEESEPSTPPTPSSFTVGEIMDGEEAEPSTPPTPTPLTLGEIMELAESEPSTPPTPTPLTGAEIMDGEKAEPYKVPPPTPLTLVEIKEQTVDIDEIVKSISEWIKDQVMKDKTKKFPMNKSHHSKYTKRVQLFIKSLDYSVDDKRLHKEFLPFGAVVSAKVVMENGRSKGFGYVSYSSINEAMEAIKGMNGKMLGRRPIHVALSNCREEYKPQLTWTEQKTGSSRPTNPWQSPLKDTQRVQSQSLRRVWIVGDSYVRRSEARARETMGANLGVASQVEWFCRGGMCWGELLYFFKQCLEGRTAPDVLVIHCGGNDLGRVERVLLLRTMKRDLFELHRQFPQMKILFSSINQRRQWQHGLPGKVEKVRTFVNNEMATFVSYINGSFVPHPHILFNKPELYLRDGVHLSPKGHDIFLTGIVQCLRDLSP